MPWIRQIPVSKATGLLKKEFEGAIKRAGRVWNIVHIMSLNPRVLMASMGHYGAIMFGDPKEADAFVHSIVRDWRATPLDPTDRALCELATKLTQAPAGDVTIILGGAA
jgi:hypothetical protein